MSMRWGARSSYIPPPGDADFFHNYTKTTPTNESVCTIKPCPDPREDVLTPQPRGPIEPDSESSTHN
jgi:hypothetical protein